LTETELLGVKAFLLVSVIVTMIFGAVLMELEAAAHSASAGHRPRWGSSRWTLAQRLRVPHRLSPQQGNHSALWMAPSERVGTEGVDEI
jgi:hypothetical protein